MDADIKISKDGKTLTVFSHGNGRLDAVSNALKDCLGLDFTVSGYEQHALTSSSRSKAVSYVAVTGKDGQVFWGAGLDDDIIKSSYKALASAVNNFCR